MDFVTGYKNKLAYFRIKELKDVLTQLGIGKQGRKQDLVDRILVLLSDEQVSKMQGLARRNYIGKEGVAKIIDDTYRKMQIPGATELASKGQTISDITSVNVKDEVEDSFQLDDKVRCPCGSSLHAELMVQCKDLRCRVWQHTSCVVVLEKPSDTCPPEFYCEICRINRADPFWVTVAQPMYPVKLTTTNVPTEGTNPLQNVEKTFQLTRADRDLLQKPDHDVQAWCILLNDKVPFRMQWPLYPDLQVNGLPVRTINRPGSQLLGASGRDDGPIITTYIREGINKISLSGCDARVFCLGLRIVKRLTVQQVLNLIPKEPDGESFDDALTRVRRCIGGGTSTDNGDSDSDVEVVADSVPVNLRCPMSGSRIKIAGRFKPCRHMGCFDLETFVELNERSRKWQCPICLNNFSLENVIIDTYFNRITKMMHPCGEDVIEIDVKPDGSWRAKNENVHSELGRWHFPDGTLCFSTNGDVKPNSEALKFIKQESGSEGLSNGFWDVSKHDVMHSLSSGDQLQNFENNCRKVMPTSSSTTGSGRDGEDPSVSQDGVVPFNFSLSDGLELDSFPVKYNPTDGVSNRNASAPAVQELIILSDSDENDNFYEIDRANNVRTAFPVATPGISNSYQENNVFGAGEISCLGLFNDNEDDFEMPLWPLPSDTQAGPRFQPFSTDADASDALLNLQQSSVISSLPMNGYSLPPETAMQSAINVSGSSICQSTTDINDGLVDNPVAFGSDDPLQIFLPTRPAGTSMQTDLREQTDISNGLHSEDWISLSLGGSSTTHGERAQANRTSGNQSGTVNGFSRNQFASEEIMLEPSANVASLLLSMNNNSSDRTPVKKPRSDGPFSHPRQPRSVRPRLHIPIERDSD